MTIDDRFTRSDVQAVADTLRYLQAVGSANAVPRAQVRALLPGISDRRLRSMVEAAPSMGIRIASTTDGYFICATVEDARRCVADLRSRAVHHIARANALEGLFVPQGELFT